MATKATKSAPKPIARAAKKSAPAATKATAKKAAPAAATKSAPKKTAAAPTKAPAATSDRAANNDALITQIMDMRNEGRKFSEITETLGIAGSRVNFLYNTGLAREKGTKNATPATIKKDRDEGKMSWVQIAVQYGLSKAQTQRLYREAGGDPNMSVIGKGGRYFSFEDATAKAREKASAERKGTPAKKAPAAKKEAAPKAAPSKPAKRAAAGSTLFNDEATKEEIVNRIDGKTIAVKLSMGGEKSFKVKGGSVSYGKVKGVTSVRFTETGTGATRTVAVNAIVGAK